MTKQSDGGSLYFDAGVDIKKLLADFERAREAANKFGQQVQATGKDADRVFSGMGSKLTTFFTLAAAGGFIKQMIDVRSQFQQLEISFNTMIGSKAKADKLFAEVVQFAAATPFQLTDLAASTKQLLAFGVASDDVMKYLKALGDVSAGLGVDISRLILNFGQVKNLGKLTGREVRDFAVAGVPILGELGKNLGKTEEQITKLVTAGKIGFKDVAKAFVTMSSEGGRFENLMEKQNKTLNGQISNLKDLWAQTMNSIGKGQEGLAYDVIHTLQNMVVHYQGILDILKILIVTYGSYRAAVALVAAYEGAKRILDQVAAYNKLRNSLTAAAAAQKAFGAASLTTGIGIAVAAVAGLVAILAIFVLKSKSTKDVIDDLNKSIASIGEQDNIDGLIEKYKALNGKTVEGTVAHEELKAVIIKLGGIYPSAIEKVNKYSEAVVLNTEKLIAQNEALKTSAKLLGEKELEAAIKRRKELILQQENLVNSINTKKGVTSQGFTYDISEKMLVKMGVSLKKVTAEIGDLSKSIDDGNAKMHDLGKIDTDKILEPYKDLFADVEKLTEDQAKKNRKSLTELLTKGLPEDVNVAIKGQIEKINKYLSIPINSKQVKQLMTDLAEAEKIYKGLLSGGTRSTEKQKTDAQARIKDLKDQLKVYGIEIDKNEKKEDQKAAKDRKLAEARIKDERHISEQMIQLELDTQEGEVAAMSEGFDKRMAEADLQYEKERAQIKKERQERIDAINEANNKIPGEKGFVSELPKLDEAAYTKRAETAIRVRNAIVEQLSKDSAKVVQDIQDESLANFKTDQQNEIDAVQKTYKEKRELLQKQEETPEQIQALKDLETKKQDDILSIKRYYALMGVDLNEETAQQIAEIENKSFGNTRQLEIKKLNIIIEFAKKRLTILQASGKDTDQKEAQRLENEIKVWQKQLRDLKTEQVDSIIEGFGDIANEIAGINSDLGSMVGLLSDAIGIFGNIAKEDYVGAIAGLINIILKAVKIQSDIDLENKNRENEVLQLAIKINDILAERVNLYVALGFISKQAGEFQSITLLQQRLEEIKRTLGSFRTQFGGWMVGIKDSFTDIMTLVYGEGWDAADVQNAMSDLDAFYRKYIKIRELWTNPTDLAAQFNTEDFNKAINDYLAAAAAIKAIQDQIRQALTGTTSDDIAQSIVDGFAAGKSSAADFADTFEQMMKKAMLASFKSKILTQQLDAFYETFAGFNTNGLSEEEIHILQQMYANIINGADVAWKNILDIANLTGINMTDLTGTAGTADAGLTGQIKGITQEQADLLGGLAMSMREYLIKIYNLMLGGSQNGNSDYLYNIAGNVLLTSINDQQRLALSAFNDMRNIDLSGIKGSLITIGETQRLFYNEFVSMKQIQLTDLVITNRQIAENTAYNRILPEIKNELLLINMNLKNL